MTWSEAENALKAHIEAQWAIGSHATTTLVWDNETTETTGRWMYVSIEGVYAEKTIYGSVGKRSSQECGIVFFHSFVPTGEGKGDAVAAVQEMTGILELQTVLTEIRLEGGEPPSPVEYGRFDREVPRDQPGGNYYRCSGSVPFMVTDTR